MESCRLNDWIELVGLVTMLLLLESCDAFEGARGLKYCGPGAVPEAGWKGFAPDGTDNLLPGVRSPQ